MVLKLSAFNFIIIIMSQHAEYCSECHFPFKQMGACPKPGQSMLWAYISMIPYLIPFFILGLFIFTKKLHRLRNFLLLASCYVLGDKVLKNIIQSSRPLYSCKASFGMPSSHMAVMMAFCFLKLKRRGSDAEKVVWVGITILEGISRVILNYHTFEQVIAGSAYGLIFAFFFTTIWSRTLGKWLKDLFKEERMPESDHRD